jgi:hypothetical protein
LRPLLAAHGINWNWKTAQLAACPWVTGEYVAAHVKAQPDNLGLAITLMLRGAPAPHNPAALWGETPADRLIFDE